MPLQLLNAVISLSDISHIILNVIISKKDKFWDFIAYIYLKVAPMYSKFGIPVFKPLPVNQVSSKSPPSCFL